MGIVRNVMIDFVIVLCAHATAKFLSAIVCGRVMTTYIELIELFLPSACIVSIIHKVPIIHYDHNGVRVYKNNLLQVSIASIASKD